MTKSYITHEKPKKTVSDLWEHNIIARKLTIKNISQQLRYNLIIYTQEKESLTHLLIFLFLGMIQMFFYTFGAFTIKLQYQGMPPLK